MATEPEAIGGDMESWGVYAACHESKVEWIVLKAICDWADGNKSENKRQNQQMAAKNAAEFLFHILQDIINIEIP
jgi:nucleoside phosphorylase